MSSSSLLVLDTNVLVSALLNPSGAPGKIWDRVVSGELRLAYDDRILLEYEIVLKRPKFGFDPRDIDALVESFVLQESVSSSLWPLPLPDPQDALFLEVAAASSAPLIRGNARHFPPDLCRGVSVFAPHQWLEEERA